YPEIYAEIKELVKKKRFEPIGGVYVQSSTNLLGGESLVRQCLYGKRFFRKEFDFDVKVGWLPDTFGFAYSLPQIYKQAGIDVLFTQKLRYNDTNSHYDSHHIPSLMFNWEGCDGSRILMYNTGSYKHLTTDSMDFMMYNLGYYYNKAKHLPMPGYLAPYGFGDGGGGVNRKQLEYIKRLPDTPGFPKTETGSVEEFFEKQPKDRLDTVRDELYLEAHRGTYTTQGKIKKYNRQCEIQIRNAEILSVCAGLDNKEELSHIWKKILFNQFHDILPGSTVHEGVTDAHASYEEILGKLKKITDKALEIFAQRQDTDGKGQAVMVFIPLSFTREDIAEISLSDLPVRDNISVRNSMGETVHCQVSGDRLLFETQTFPMASSVYYIEEKSEGNKGIPFRGTKNVFSNSFYEIEFGRDGYIRKIFDKDLEKEILSGRSNVFQVFEDRCGYFDAWDIDPQFENHKSEFFCVKPPTVIEKGSLRMTVRTEYAFGRSRIVQDMILYRNIKRIDFETYADWQEEHLMLKTAFETSVRTSFASYEIPYGIIQRPTTRNNSYEKGKFEVCGQRWADLSAPDYGVSVLNDCKYGWDIKDNVMRLTLLRSPKFPDATADMGEHRFTYSLLSHGTGLQETVKEAHKLNNPLYAITADNHKGVNDFLLTTSDDIIIDCVKGAEDSSDIIVRLYEPYGRRTLGFILFGKKIEEICETDILEEKTESADIIDDMLLKFVIKPFEIKTYRLKLKN
ncbi:MAG: alpha-mannosidase, partial [Armatimonadetes bacterium]|nr:alpha-mannosidase [Candidatus Hippobium faecium]